MQSDMRKPSFFKVRWREFVSVTLRCSLSRWPGLLGLMCDGCCGFSDNIQTLVWMLHGLPFFVRYFALELGCEF